MSNWVTEVRKEAGLMEKRCKDLEARNKVLEDALLEISQNVGDVPPWGDNPSLQYHAANTLLKVANMPLQKKPYGWNFIRS